MMANHRVVCPFCGAGQTANSSVLGIPLVVCEKAPKEALTFMQAPPVTSDLDCCDEEATATVKSFTTGTSATRLISSLTDKMPRIKLREWLQQQWDLGNRRFCANCTYFKPECGPEAEVPFDHGECTFDVVQLVMPTAVRIESCYTDAAEGADCPFHEPLPDGIPQDAPWLDTEELLELLPQLPEQRLFKILPSGGDSAKCSGPHCAWCNPQMMPIAQGEGPHATWCPQFRQEQRGGKQ